MTVTSADRSNRPTAPRPDPAPRPENRPQEATTTQRPQEAATTARAEAPASTTRPASTDRYAGFCRTPEMASAANRANDSAVIQQGMQIKDQRRAGKTGDSPLIGEAPAPTPIVKTASPNAAIEDNKTTTATIEVGEKAKIENLKLDLDINHTYRGDLVVTLTSPSGKSAVVSNKQGGSADDLKGTFDLSVFKGEETSGVWKLTVQDTARADVGKLNKWGLTITPEATAPPDPEPPKPDPADSDPMTHIRYLSSDAMEGRDSPSGGLARAAEYVQGMAEKYGLKGPNVNNPANPYLQQFDLFNFAGLQSEHDLEHGDHAPGAAATPHNKKSDWGSKTFESGFFLDENMSKESLEILNKRYEDLSRANGKAPVASLTGGLRSVQELQALAAPDPTKVQNVMGLLEGTGPNKDEVIVVMAHLDHVGKGSRGVYNGADDNASGSSVLLAAMPELAKAQKEGKLNRSILFLWTGAEEQGLVGSQYFADHPIPGLGLDKISGVVNMDMIGRWDDQRISVVDTNTRNQPNYFREIADRANAKMADPFDRVNRDINAFRDRQDGAVFTRRGEDVLFVFEGLSRPTGGGDLIPEYHGTGDDVDLILRDNGGNKPRRVKDFMVDVLTQAANKSTQAVVPTAAS